MFGAALFISVIPVYGGIIEMDLIRTLIDENMIKVQQPAADWKEAVKIGIKCLLDANKVTWGYYNAIIRSVKTNGPYFVLMPGVALPHARPEEGVIDSGFSLVTLQTPIDFGSPENDPISILLSFAAKDVTEQVEQSLSQAVTLFEDERRVQAIMDATTINQMKKVLLAIEKKTNKKSLSERWRGF